MGHALIRYRYSDQIKWGVLHKEKVYELKNVPESLKDIIASSSSILIPENYAIEPIAYSSVEILPPVNEPLRVICQGVNYASHREESALTSTSQGNVIFAKDSSSITGADNNIVRPKDCQCLDYEVELGLIIRQDITEPTKVTDNQLYKYIGGFVLANDMSPRDLQYKDDFAQWFKGKSYRTMLPLGPVVFIPDIEDFKYLNQLELKLWVNGELRQHASTAQLIFKPAQTLTELSEIINLSAGDLLLTGTPGGVIIKAPNKFLQGLATWLLSNEQKVAALRKHKDSYLRDGDIIKCEIASKDGKIHLGTQNNRIVSKP